MSETTEKLDGLIAEAVSDKAAGIVGLRYHGRVLTLAQTVKDLLEALEKSPELFLRQSRDKFIDVNTMCNYDEVDAWWIHDRQMVIKTAEERIRAV